MALTLLNFAGWETGEVSSGGAVGNVSNAAWEGTVVYGSGTGAVKLTKTGGGTCEVRLRTIGADGALANGSSNMIAVAAKFRYSTKPASLYERIMSGHVAADGLKWFLALNSTGTVALYNSSSTLVATSAATLSADTWYDLRIEAETSSTTAEFRLWINGTLEINETAIATTGTSHGHIKLGASANINSQGLTCYYDDVIMYGGSNDGEAGEAAAAAAMTIRGANANGNGNYTAWTGDYTAVDETPPSPGDYVDIAANTAGAETFTLENCSTIGLGASDTITAVRFITQLAEAAAGTSSVNTTRVRNGSTDVDTTARDPGTSAIYSNILRTTDPNGGGAWTQSGFDSCEVGANNNSASYTAGVRLYWAGAEVLYTPSTNISFELEVESLSAMSAHAFNLTQPFALGHAALAAAVTYALSVRSLFTLSTAALAAVTAYAWDAKHRIALGLAALANLAGWAFEVTGLSGAVARWRHLFRFRKTPRIRK